MYFGTLIRSIYKKTPLLYRPCVFNYNVCKQHIHSHVCLDNIDIFYTRAHNRLCPKKNDALKMFLTSINNIGLRKITKKYDKTHHTDEGRRLYNQILNHYRFYHENLFVSETVLCAICMEHEANTVMNCGHVICKKCKARLHECPFCRELF
jgi:hypothetical protein